MAKAFFFQNQNSLVWVYGDFKADGITPKVELTVPSGLYRSRWETVNEVVQLTILNANNIGELHPFRAIPITDVASDIIGTPYADRAAFELATKDFFFSGTSGLAASTGLGEVSLTVVEAQVAYSLPLDCDITKTPFVVYADGTTRTEPSEYTLSTELGIPTITFNVAPTVGNIPYILYTKVSIATQVEVTLTDNIGVTNGAVDAVLSDTVDLAHPGWICPRLLAGNIKFTDMEGNVDTWAFELKEFSPMRVKRVWLNGTTADMGIKVIY